MPEWAPSTHRRNGAGTLTYPLEIFVFSCDAGSSSCKQLFRTLLFSFSETDETLKAGKRVAFYYFDSGAVQEEGSWLSRRSFLSFSVAFSQTSRIDSFLSAERPLRSSLGAALVAQPEGSAFVLSTTFSMASCRYYRLHGRMRPSESAASAAAGGRQACVARLERRRSAGGGPC